jgi:hypothetical protein
MIGDKKRQFARPAGPATTNHPPRGGQAYCIFLFITGASVFGLLISHFNETWEAEGRAHREMEDAMDPFLAVRPRSARSQVRDD